MARTLSVIDRPPGVPIVQRLRAGVAESADARVSKTRDRKIVGVQVPPPAHPRPWWRPWLLCAALAACTGGPRELAVTGDWRHPSGAVFPARIGFAERVSLRVLDPAGADAAVTYRATFGEAPLLVTFYLYPRTGEPLAVHLERCTDEVLRSHAGATVSNAAPAAGDAPGAPQAAVRFLFRAPLGPGTGDAEVASYLVLGERHGWWSKVRVTVPVLAERRGLPAIAALLASAPQPLSPPQPRR